MGEELQVRKATAADIPVLVGLMGEFYAESGYELDDTWAARTFVNLLSDDRNGCWN